MRARSSSLDSGMAAYPSPWLIALAGTYLLERLEAREATVDRDELPDKPDDGDDEHGLDKVEDGRPDGRGDHGAAGQCACTCERIIASVITDSSPPGFGLSAAIAEA